MAFATFAAYMLAFTMNLIKCSCGNKGMYASCDGDISQSKCSRTQHRNIFLWLDSYQSKLLPEHTNKCSKAFCNGNFFIHTFSNVDDRVGRAKSKHTFLKLNPNHMYPLLKAKYPPPPLPSLCSAVLSCLLCCLSPLLADPENRAKKEQELEKNMKRS